MPTVTSTLELSAARQFPVMRCARVPGFSIDLGRVVIHRCALMTQANTKMICTEAAAAAAAAKVHTHKRAAEHHKLISSACSPHALARAIGNGQVTASLCQACTAELHTTARARLRYRFYIRQSADTRQMQDQAR
eukprot:1376-Heterococcus_DN1.PRE.1